MALTRVHEDFRAVVAALGNRELLASPDHGERLRRLVAGLPRKVWLDVQDKVTTQYARLEARYGRPMAVAIISSAVVGTAIPVPGTTILASAPLIALAELHYRLTATDESAPSPCKSRIALTEAQARRHAKRLVHQLEILVKKAHRVGAKKEPS